MSGPLREEISAAWEEAKPRLRRALVRLLVALRALWHLVRPPLAFALEILLALILLFEEWGWRPLVAALAWLTRFPLWARLELAVAGLPPYGALAALALPSSILFPLKFVSLFLLAQGKVVMAGLVFVGAKIASTALIARIFLLTKPALMRIGWFKAAYDWITPWKEALFATIRASWAWRYGRMLKNRMRQAARRAWSRFGPAIVARWQRIRMLAREVWLRVRARLDEGALRLRHAVRRALRRA